MTRQYGGLFLAAGVVILGVGCLPEFVASQGEYLLYEHSSKVHACAGNAAYADAVVPFLEQQLAVTAPELLRYTWVQDGDLSPALGLHTAGFTIGQHAMSFSPFSSHELTHAVMGGASAKFFTEGVAVAMEILYDGYGPRYIDPVSFKAGDWDPRPTMTVTRNLDVDYAVAGAFVTYLLVQHGPEPFSEFYRSLHGPVTRSYMDGQFRRFYGLELEDEIEIFIRGVPACEPDAFAVLVPECSTPTVEWQDPQLWRFETTMDCEDVGVVGGITPKGAAPSVRAVTVDVPKAGSYFIKLTRSDEAWLRFGRCFGCPWDDTDIRIEGKVQLTTAYLEAGRHFVRIGSKSDLSPDVTVEILP